MADWFLQRGYRYALVNLKISPSANSPDAVGKLDEAVVSYEESLRYPPEEAAAHNNLGVAYKILGRNSDAIASYRSALRIQPTFPAAHNPAANLPTSSGCIEVSTQSFFPGIAT